MPILSVGRQEIPPNWCGLLFLNSAPPHLFFLIKIFAWGRKQRISLWAGITTCSQKRDAVGGRARRDIGEALAAVVFGQGPE